MALDSPPPGTTHPRLFRAGRFQDLLVRRVEDDPYVFSSIFNNDTWRARRLSTKKLKLLRQIDPTLRAMLAPGEKVHFVTVGNGVSSWESYFLGWVAYVINRRAIILSDHRILLIQIDRKLRPHTFRSQMRYLSIDSLTWPRFGNLRVKMRNKKTHLYAFLPRRDRASLRTFIQRKQLEFRGYRPEALDLEELCPRCHRPIDGRPRQCPNCRAGFKSPVKASLLSLLFPGLGDLYLGHKTFAALEMVGAAAAWLGFLLATMGTTVSVAGKVAGAASLLAIVHGFDALATRHVARKGLYPAHQSRETPSHARAA